MPDRYILFCYSSVVQRRSTKKNRWFDFSLRRFILQKLRFAYGGLCKSLSSLFVVLLRAGWIAIKAR